MFTHICENCGEKFQHSKRNRKYCNMECFRSDPNLGEKIAKTKCGKTYEEIYGHEVGSRLRKLRSKAHKGDGNPFYGRRHTKETLKKLSESCSKAQMGHKHSPETIEKIRQKATGRIMSKETKRKISKTKTGVSVKRTKVQHHYQTSKLEETFQKRYPAAIHKYAAHHYEWDFKRGKWLVEIDGDYWHGLDRTEDHTRDQKHNMANDERKNQAVIRNKSNLLRFKGTRGDDLDKEPYMIIEKGELL